MRLEHRIVDARVGALAAAERLLAGMVALVEIVVVLVLGDERTLRAAQDFFRIHVLHAVRPQVGFDVGHKVALFAFALFRVAFGVVVRLVDAVLVLADGGLFGRLRAVCRCAAGRRAGWLVGNGCWGWW